MNSLLSKEEFKNLLDLLENNEINVQQFYRLIELDDSDIRNIRETISLKDVVEKEELINQLLTCSHRYLVGNILREYPEFRKNIEKRNFVIKNANEAYINHCAPLIQYDFIFNDKELLKIMLKTKREGFHLYGTETVTNLVERIKKNPKFYMDGSKNDYLKQGFSIKNCRSLNQFMVSMPMIEKFENPKWYSYLAKACNSQSLLQLDISFPGNLNTILKYNKKEELNNKLFELDKMELDDSEKLEMFVNLIDNLRYVAVEKCDNIENEKYFSYLMSKIFEDTLDFDTHDGYVELFTSEDSPCKEGSELYKAIFEVEDCETRKPICNALETSLKNAITVEFVKDCKYLEEEEVEKLLEKLAEKQNASDYLEEYCRKNKNSWICSDELIEYMNNHPNLTRQELLALREKVEMESVQEMATQAVNLATQAPMIYQQEDNTLKGKVKTMAKKLFSCK